jgi:hypothetical protein
VGSMSSQLWLSVLPARQVPYRVLWTQLWPRDFTNLSWYSLMTSWYIVERSWWLEGGE